MKKTFVIIFFVALVFFTKNSFAQDKAFLFGFNAAPNIGWMKPDAAGYENDGTKTGFSWGFVTQFFLMENYYVITGFDVNYLNSRLIYPHKLDDIEGVLYRHYQLKYIEVPLELKMMTREFGNARFFGKIGLGTSFLIDADSKDVFESGGNESHSSEEDIKKSVKPVRESLILGFGVDYSLGGSTALSLGLNFDNGFVDVLKDQNTIDPNINHNAFNNFIELNIGIIF